MQRCSKLANQNAASIQIDSLQDCCPWCCQWQKRVWQKSSTWWRSACLETAGPGQLRAYWESKVHVVVKRRSSDEVELEGGGKNHVLHPNLLFPCDSLSLDSLGNTRNKIGERTRHCQKQGNIIQADNWRVLTSRVEKTSFVHDLGKQETGPEKEEIEADIGNTIPRAEPEDDAAESGESLQESPEEDDLRPPPATIYLQRERRLPKMLTCGVLGEPTVVEVGVKNLPVTMSPAFESLWWPWAVLDIEVTS